MTKDKLLMELLGDGSFFIEFPEEHWEYLLKMVDAECDKVIESIDALPESTVDVLSAREDVCFDWAVPLLCRAIMVESLLERGLVDRSYAEHRGLDWVKSIFDFEESFGVGGLQ